MATEVPGEDTAQAETEEVETQEEQEESATSEEVEPESEQEKEQPSEPPKPKGVQKRIAELTANWRSTERDRDYWRDMAMQKQQGAQPQQQESKKVLPTLESVGYDEAKYQAAMVDYLDSQVDTRLTEREKQQQTQKQQQEFQTNLNNFYQKGSSVAEDFADVVGSANGITQAMGDALLALDNGPQVAYHLAQNPAELARISSLNPYAQAAEIGRLEVRLTAPKPNSSSKAPAPIKPLRAGGESASKDPDQMTTKEWLEWRNAQLSKR